MEELKTNKQVLPLQLLSESRPRPPYVCLDSVDLFDPKSATQLETGVRVIHGHKGLCISLSLGP